MIVGGVAEIVYGETIVYPNMCLLAEYNLIMVYSTILYRYPGP